MDVTVVGAGIIGCSAAAFLAEAGARVTVYDRSGIAAGASGRNSGVLQHPLDDRLAAWHTASVALHREVTDLPAEPEGLLILGRASTDGLPAELTPQALDDAREAEPLVIAEMPGILVNTGWVVGPTALTQAWWRRAEAAGAQLVTGDEAPPAGEVTLIATGAWTAGITPLYGVTARVRPRFAARHILEESAVDSIVNGTEAEFFTLVGDVLGSSFNRTEPDANAVGRRLRERARPFIGFVDVTSARACPRPQSPDGLPLIGQIAERTWVCAGHGAWGVSTGPATAKLVTGAILEGTEIPMNVQPEESGLKTRRRAGDNRGAMLDVNACLQYLVQSGGSDLHLKVPSPPLVRLDGELVPVPGTEPLTPHDTQQAVSQMLVDKDKLAEFAEDREVDFAYAIDSLGRFRVNAFHQRGSVSIVARAIPFSVRTIEELSLPPVIRELAEEERGIILVTGTTGSGKSTTLASMIDHMNQTMSKHIVTIEDPIEFLHRDQRSIINQREVGQDTHSFKRALRRVLRQDPDVILIGEMRDEETVHTALSAAETGHLVLSTVHTVDAPETINRIIDFFPPHMHQQVRAMLGGTLKGVISQRLVRAENGGRVATCEVLRMTGRIRDMIVDPEQTGRLPEALADGAYYGMQTFDQALFDHVKAGRVSREEAMRAATSPHDFKLLLAADGRRGTTMEDVYDGSPSNGNGNGKGVAATPQY